MIIIVEKKAFCKDNFNMKHLRLNASNLTLWRNEQIILHQISFLLNSGEALQITGPNGVGKSSLLRAVAGLLPPIQGHVFVNDEDIFKAPQANDCFFLNHQLFLYPQLNISENLKLWSTHFGMSGQDLDREHFKIADLLEEFPNLLSEGQKRRVLLTLLSGSINKIWLLDEPYSYLDRTGKDTLSKLIEQHLSQQGIVIFTSHEQIQLPFNVETLALETINLDHLQGADDDFFNAAL